MKTKPECEVGFAGTDSERTILNIKNRLNRSKEKSNLTDYELSSLEVLSDEHQKKGIDYLKKYCFTPKGGFRKNIDRFVAQIVGNIKEVRFSHFYDISKPTSNFRNYVVVYKAISNHGSHFTYYTNGGKMIVEEMADASDKGWNYNTIKI